MHPVVGFPTFYEGSDTRMILPVVFSFICLPVQLMSEVLWGVRMIKMHAWEPLFQARVERVREEEVGFLRQRKYLDALCVFFWATTPVLVSVLTFVTYVLMGHQLTAAKVSSLLWCTCSLCIAFQFCPTGSISKSTSKGLACCFSCLPNTVYPICRDSCLLCCPAFIVMVIAIIA